MEHRIQHDYDLDAADFWRVYFLDDAYGRALYAHLRIEIVSREIARDGDGGALVRRTIMQPRRDLPGFLRRLVGGASRVQEVARYDPADHSVRLDVTLPVIGRRVAMGGRFLSEPLGPGRFRRVWLGRCDARLPLVGRRLEGYLLEELASSLAAGDAFTRAWLAEHPGAGAAEAPRP